MIVHNEPEVSETGTLHSWTGKDAGGAYTASVFIPFDPNRMAIMKGSYDDGHGKKIDKQMPLVLLEGMWQFHNLSRGFKVWST